MLSNSWHGSLRPYAKTNEALKEALAPLVPREELPGSVWADKHFYLCKESSGIAGPWKSRPYQIFMIDVIYNKWVSGITIRKARRVGGTKTTLAGIWAMIDQREATTRIYRPSENLAKRYMLSEINPSIRDIEVIRNKLAGDYRIKSSENSISMKAFVGCILDVVTGTVDVNFRDVHCDTVVLDELSAFPTDVEGTGSPVKNAAGRTDGATYPKIICLTTPNDERNALIDDAIAESDELMTRRLPCPTCGEHHRLEWVNFDVPMSKFACPHCGDFYGYEHYRDMDKAGFWANEDGSLRYDDERHVFTNAEGIMVKAPKTVGIDIWGAYSYQKNWEFLSEEWRNAILHHKQGNSAYMKSFVTTILGQTYKEQKQALNHEKLLRLRVPNADWRQTIPNEVLLITVGADIQGGGGARIELEIVGWGLQGKSWSLDYVVLFGDPLEDEVWLHLDEQLRRKFIREDGVPLYIRCAMIDAGWPTTRVYAYTKPRQELNVFSVMGVEKGMVPNRPVNRGENNTRLYTSSTTEAKGTLIKQLQEEGDGYGRCYFPGDRSDDYFKQLANIKRIKRYDKNKMFLGYGYAKNRDDVRDEAVDCRHYAMAAKGKINAHMQTMKDLLDAEAAKISGTKKR